MSRRVGSIASPSRRVDRSRGRALRSAIRDEDAFQVAERAELVAQRFVRTRIDQGRHGMVAFAEHATVAQRAVQPAAQQAAAHRRDG